MSLCSPPLIETYREGAVCPSYACLFSSVLSLLQKPVNVSLMSRTVSGNEFQIEGPEVAKLCDPYRANQLRGIVNTHHIVNIIIIIIMFIMSWQTATEQEMDKRKEKQ